MLSSVLRLESRQALAASLFEKGTQMLAQTAVFGIHSVVLHRSNLSFFFFLIFPFAHFSLCFVPAIQLCASALRRRSAHDCSVRGFATATATFSFPFLLVVPWWHLVLYPVLCGFTFHAHRAGAHRLLLHDEFCVVGDVSVVARRGRGVAKHCEQCDRWHHLE